MILVLVIMTYLVIKMLILRISGFLIRKTAVQPLVIRLPLVSKAHRMPVRSEHSSYTAVSGEGGS